MTDAKRTKYDMDTLCVNNIRALSADVVQGAKSGHPGAPMGCAPVRSFIFTFFANERCRTFLTSSSEVNDSFESSS